MENQKQIASYVGNNDVHETMNYIKPGVDLLNSIITNQPCNIGSVKFSALNTMPLYRLLGMSDVEDNYFRLEELFGNTLEQQQHTIGTLSVMKLNKNISNEVNIKDDSIYYPVGSYVHLAFNQSFPTDEVLYVRDLVITYTGAYYNLLDSLGNLIEKIPSGLITLKHNASSGKELELWERKGDMVYRVANETLAGEMPIQNECEMMPPEVAEMIKNLEGKTPEEAMAIMANVNATVTLDGEAIEPSLAVGEEPIDGEMIEAEYVAEKFVAFKDVNTKTEIK